jgi:hypothetical protein
MQLCIRLIDSYSWPPSRCVRSKLSLAPGRTIPIVTDTTAGTVVAGVVTRRDLTAALSDSEGS